jgi:arylsulfatase A-like enzyme
MSRRTRPNIVVVITDDHGYGDLGCFGSNDLKTPHLDRLAAAGAVLTECYSNSPVCSPSRAAILRGQHPARTGVDDVLGGPRTEEGLTGSHPTIASELKDLGYRTSMIGKWHLGVAPGSRPSDHGFDEWFGTLSGGIDYFSHINYNLWPWNVTFSLSFRSSKRSSL